MLLRNIPPELAEDIVLYLPTTNETDVSQLFHLNPTIISQLPARVQLLLKYRRDLPKEKLLPINLALLIEESKNYDFTGEGIDVDFAFASRYGHLEVVKLLLLDPRVDPAYRRNDAIIEASVQGRLEVVKLLLLDPRVDPSDQDNSAIKSASFEGRVNVVELLQSDPRVNPTGEFDNGDVHDWMDWM